MENLYQEIREHLINDLFQGAEPTNFNNDYDLIEDGTMDSLAIMNLITYLEGSYNITFGSTDIVPEHFSSINALGNFVKNKNPSF